MLTVENVTYEINQRKLVRDITFNIIAGELMVIIGANGAGKSTLLKMLSGERQPCSGEIKLWGKRLKDYSLQDLALKRAVLNQQNAINMDFLCAEVVMMGRYPHFRSRPSSRDHQVVSETMKVCGVEHLAERSFLTLSGGEKQRIQFARVLAQVWDQQEALILMDEPVAGMDMQYQQQTLAIVKALCQRGFIVVVVLHEINLASLYADRILMLKSGRKWKDGTPAEVLNPMNIYTVFNVETEVQVDARTLQANVRSKELRMNAFHFNSFIPKPNQIDMTLREKYRACKEENPKARIRDVAGMLNVSEAELLMTNLGDGVTRLTDKFEALLEAVPTLGYVMALTRNEYAVHERKGIYGKMSFNPHVGLVLGEDIDLRLFLKEWAMAFAVEEGGKKSLQFFNHSGMALHKIYLTDKSEMPAFDSLITKFRHEQQQAPEIQRLRKAIAVEALPDTAVDSVGFAAAWNALKDTHNFYPLIKSFGLNRLQALRLAPENRAIQISFEAVKDMLAKCVEKQIPIMVFVSNPGCIQIHSGTISNLVGMGEWFNILDQEFNLHLKEDAVSSAWQVEKPSVDGDIHSLELFDDEGEMILQIFGKRKPGQAELSEWQMLFQMLNLQESKS